MRGIFYAAPSPDEPPFVKEGQKVSKGDVLCLVEAFKMFNEVEAEQSGTIVRCLVENATEVDGDQPMFEIKLD